MLYLPFQCGFLLLHLHINEEKSRKEVEAKEFCCTERVRIFRSLAKDELS